MSFRYPIDTAFDVDTRTVIGTPGVYTTESNDGAGNTTVSVHLADGFGADADATITRTAAVNTHAQAQSLTGGTSAGGGSYGGTTAPHTEYNVEPVSGGGTQPVLRLVAGAGGRIVADVAADALVPRTALTLNTTGTDFAALPGWRAPSFTKLANGLVVCSGMVKTSGAFGLGVTIATLPAGCRPSDVLPFALFGWNTGLWRCDVQTGGQITYQAALLGTAAAANSFLCLDGIAFPADQ